MSTCDLKSGRTLYRGQKFTDILSMLSTGVVPFYCEASFTEKNNWQPLMQLEGFGAFISAKLMLAANGYSYDSLFNHWYVKDGERSFGPFSLVQMLEFFQQKRIHLDTLVRHPSYGGWESFGASGPFAVKSLEQLMKCQDIVKIITRRKFPRIQYDNEVFVSASAELYRGVTWSLSTGGLGIVTDQSTVITAGQRVNIIVNSNNDHGSVQVKGRVVNLRKEVNYERLAIEFDQPNEALNKYIDQRVPSL